MRRFFYNMPGVLRTATAFLLIFSCMVSASAASVRAEERMERLAALEAEGTTAETMAGTAGGANEQIKQKVIEQAMAATGIPNQKNAGEGQAESAGTVRPSGPNAPVQAGAWAKPPAAFRTRRRTWAARRKMIRSLGTGRKQDRKGKRLRKRKQAGRKKQNRKGKRIRKRKQTGKRKQVRKQKQDRKGKQIGKRKQIRKRK